jgi:site-specific DNA recombinase
MHMTSTLPRHSTGLRRPARTRVIAALRVVIYLRISHDDDLDRQGVQRQLADCQRYCEREGWTVVAVLEDNDISASELSTKFRPGYDAVVGMVAANEVDVVLCWTFDRLYRRPAELENFLPLIDRHHVRLITVDGTEVSPGEGALVARIRAAVAAEEVRKVKVRTRRKKLSDAETGKKHGRTPFGWNDDGSAKPGEAEHVAELVERLLAGDSLKAISRDWQARGVPVPRLRQKVKAADGTWLKDAEGKVVRELHERPWDSEGLKALARRASNAGLRSYVDDNGEQLTTTGYWEQIVTEDQWRSVCSLLDSRKRPGPTRNYLLSGLVTCGGCGGKAAGTRRGSTARSGKVTIMTVYRCMDCVKVSVPVDFTDAHVEEATVARLQADDFAELLGAARESASQAALQKVQALRAKKSALVRQFTKGRLTEDELEDGLDEVNRDLRAAEAEADRLTSGRTSALHGLTGPEAEARWAELADKPDRKRAVVALLWDITMLPRDREHWKPEDRVVIERKRAR